MRWCISNILAANRSQKGVAEGSLTPVLFFTRARIYISNSTWSQDTPKPPHLGTPPDPPHPQTPPPTSPTPHLLLYILQQRRRQRRAPQAKRVRSTTPLLLFSSSYLWYAVWYGITSTPSPHPSHHITFIRDNTTEGSVLFFSLLYGMWYGMIWYDMVCYVSTHPHHHTYYTTTTTTYLRNNNTTEGSVLLLLFY